MAVRLGELLLREKRVTPAQLQEAVSFQRANGGRLGTTLVKLGFLTDEEITTVLSRQYGVPAVNLAEIEIDPTVARLIPAETASKYNVDPDRAQWHVAHVGDDRPHQRVRDGRREVHDGASRRASRRVGHGHP